MKTLTAALIGLALAACSTPGVQEAQGPMQLPISDEVTLPGGVTMKEALWYSEQVRVSGRLFLPADHGMGSNAAAVVLAPGEGATAPTLDAYAAELASQGIVALSIDYRGWGRSGGHVYLGERIETYDKMRFSEQTPELVIRRGRIDPEHQVQDLRNAITFLQGGKDGGIDPARIGILGVDLGGGHVVSVMGMDARAKVGVAVTPLIYGQGEEEKSFLPDAATRAELIKLAREGSPPRTASAARARNEQEARLALKDYKPFWRLDAIPQTSAVRFIVAETDDEIDNVVHAAARELKGPNEVKSLPGALHKLTPSQTAEAAKLAAEWFKQRF